MSAPDCTYELATASSTAAPTDPASATVRSGAPSAGDLVIALDLASGKKIGRLGARLNEPQVKELIVAIGGERLEDLGEVEGLGGTVLLVRRLHERHGNRVRDAVRAHAGEHEQEDG